MMSAHCRNAARCIAAGALALAAAAAQAEEADSADSIPPYQARQQVSGVIRTWGHGSRQQDFIGGLVGSWQDGFARHQAGVRFEATLRGDSTAIGGLYTGAADIALMERPPLPIELDGYRPIFGHDPFQLSVATGSLAVAHHAFAPVIFVHRDNPISKLTLEQLDAIFGADHRRGPKSARTWGELGLRGEWADAPIHVYVFAITDDVSQFFERAVMAGSQKWAGNLTEFSDVRAQDGTIVEAGRQITDALAKDRFGIALSGLVYRNAQVKPVALAAVDGGPFYQADRETVRKRIYPLTRTVYVFIDREPGRPVDPKLREYLTYILGNDGQQAIERDGGYLPLTPDEARREREKLQ
jgi:phosphate transport system substrate-binding protein